MSSYHRVEPYIDWAYKEYELANTLEKRVQFSLLKLEKPFLSLSYKYVEIKTNWV